MTATTTPSAEPTRRDFLYIATGTVGAVGARGGGLAADQPDESRRLDDRGRRADRGRSRARSPKGRSSRCSGARKPIFISHRTKKEIEEAQKVNVSSLPDPQPDTARVKEGHDQWLVLIGICTHLGCIPLAHQGNYDGWFCPCHGSQYDTSGRIRQGPAPANLAVAALPVRVRHQDPHRLRPPQLLSGSPQDRSMSGPSTYRAAERIPEVVRGAPADRRASSIPRSSPTRRRRT